MCIIIMCIRNSSPCTFKLNNVQHLKNNSAPITVPVCGRLFLMLTIDKHAHSTHSHKCSFYLGKQQSHPYRQNGNNKYWNKKYFKCDFRYLATPHKEYISWITEVFQWMQNTVISEECHLFFMNK